MIKEDIMKEFRFGIAGAGVIAHMFADGLAALPGAVLAGVASNTPGRAESFANEYRHLYPEAVAYDSYEAMAQNPDIDAVYVANLNPQHKDAAILFLTHKKPVICEKPFALNAKETREMIKCAKDNDTFLMEAMWTRFQPVTRKVMEWIESGKIGDIVSVRSEFGMELMTSADRRVVAIEKGGGALLDLGIYPISYLSMLFKQTPSAFRTLVSKAVTGVDASFEAIFQYGELERTFSKIPQTAHITVAMDRSLSKSMKITGTKGMILVHHFWAADSASLNMLSPTSDGYDTPAEVYSPEWIPTGYQYEAKEVMDLVTKGKKESSIMPLSETLSLMETLDAIRNEWGLVYPQEK